MLSKSPQKRGHGYYENGREHSQEMMTRSIHSVSIVIPTYNRIRTLERAISSCQKQSHEVDEILVVDDGSTDNTSSLISQISALDPRVRYIGSPTREGAQSARIKGIMASGGSWIAFLDSDDELLPDSVQLRIRCAEQSNLYPGLVYGDMLTERGNVSKFKVLNGSEYHWLCKELSLCPYSAMMIRRACFHVTGYPDPRFPSWQDDDMVLTIGRVFPICHCMTPVAVSHFAENKITSNPYRLALGCELMVAKYKDDIVRHHGLFRLLLWQLRVRRAHLISLHKAASDKHQNLRETHQKYAPSRIVSAAYCITLNQALKLVTRYLSGYFEQMYA